MEAEVDPPRRRGRPPGSRNKPKQLDLAPVVPPSSTPLNDYRYSDPAAIVSRQITMLDWAQQALRNEMQAGLQVKGKWIAAADIERLERLSNGIVRALDAMRKLTDLTDELARRLSPEQLLDKALQKIEGQDAATIRYAIKRLRAYHESLNQPRHGAATRQMGGAITAAEAIQGLGDDDEVR